MEQEQVGRFGFADRATDERSPCGSPPSGSPPSGSVSHSAGHTPLPWRTAGGDAILAGRDENLEVVASARFDANAAFIVRACNSHYELLEVLLELFERSNGITTMLGGNPAAVDALEARAHAAIARARGAS